jgi:hypothetical protein
MGLSGVTYSEKPEAASRGGFQTRPRQDGQGYVPCGGLIVRPERREAPIRCGFARTYASGRQMNEPFGTHTR